MGRYVDTPGQLELIEVPKEMIGTLTPVAGLEVQFDDHYTPVSWTTAVNTSRAGIAAIRSRPDWIPYPWPDNDSLELSFQDIEALALLKMLCIFEFGMGDYDASDTAVHASILAIGSVSEILPIVTDSTSSLRRFRGHAYVTLAGFAQGGYDEQDVSSGINSLEWDSEKRDRYVRSVMRWLLRGELKATGSPWNPF